MKWSMDWLWVGVAVVGMLSIPRVSAASGSASVSDGRITFTGAIVEPTCAASIDADAWLPGARTALPHRFECGGTQTAGRFYSLIVVNLDAATINHDRVLDYFAGYVRAAGNNEATAKLVTQTFE